MNENKLWKVFSQYIRLRDADENGICTCITCPRRAHWKKMDTGHGIPRQHKATKYNEKNNHAQCKPCNGFEGGKREIYKEQVDKRYGKGTWDKMLIASKTQLKLSQFEIDEMERYYKLRVKELLKNKL